MEVELKNDELVVATKLRLRSSAKARKRDKTQKPMKATIKHRNKWQ